MKPEFEGEFECGDYTMAFFQHCFHAVAISAVGSTTFDFPKEAAFPIGPTKGNKFALLEVHYDNPLGMSGKEMTSGLRLKFSNSPRQFEAGHLSLGATWMFYLPPNQENFR